MEVAAGDVTDSATDDVTDNVALRYRRFGEPADVLTLERRASAPLPGGALRVRMHAAPVNPSDLVPITGAYRSRVRPPRVAGYEGIGTVVDAREGAGTVGSRVLPLRGPGTWQRYVDCDPAWAVVVPDDLDTVTAARAYINPLAAMLMLRTWTTTGRRVLLTAAGSTCAGLLAQWASDAGATEVTGVCRSAHHAGRLADLGVLPVVLPARGSASDPLDAVTVSGAITDAARRADVVFDAVGGRLAERILGELRPDAVFVSYGLLSGEAFAAPPGGPRTQRFSLRHEMTEVSPGRWHGWFRDLWPLLRRARMPEAAPFPLASWRQALALHATPGRTVKPVLDLR